MIETVHTMLLNKKLAIAAFSVLFSTGVLQAQESGTARADSASQAEARRANYLNGLHKVSSAKELKYVDSLAEAKNISNADIRFLSQDYNKIHPMTFQYLLEDSHYQLTVDTYVDDASIIRAKVMRPATQKEQEKAVEDLKKIIEESAQSPKGREREKIIAGQLGKPAPAFSVVDVDGVQYDLRQLKGKVVVLNFWFIGCAPCRREVPELNKLVEKYQSKDVVFLAFEVNGNSASKIKAVARDFHYTQVPTTRKEGDVVGKYNIKTYPTSYVIDQSGIIRFGLAAYNPFRLSDMDKTIEGLLKNKLAKK